MRPHDDADGERGFRARPVSRVWDAADGQPIEVVCFGNGDELRLTYGGEDVPVVFDEQNGYWSAVTTTRNAALELETLRGGEVVAADVLRPAGEAVRLDAAAWSAPDGVADRCLDAGLAADGVVQIECALLDSAGDLARGERTVTVEVEGGELLGLENGDLTDSTPYAANGRSTLHGRLIVFVRPGAQATVVLSSSGLPDVRLERTS